MPRKLHVRFAGAALLALAGCASAPPTLPCQDIAGVYVDASEPWRISLAEVLLGDRRPGKTVTLSTADAGATLVVRAGGTRHTLAAGTDFTCPDGLVTLKAIVTTDVAVPPLGTATERTRYTLEKAADGSLLGHRLATRSAVVFGLPFTGEALPKDDLVWAVVR